MSRSLKRIVDILDCFAPQRTVLSLAEIADVSGLDRSTALRFLVALEHECLVRRDPETKRYTLGSKLVQWGALAIGSVSIRSVAEPIMVRLHRATNETVALYIRDGDQRICIATYESPEPVRHVLPLGSTLRITQAAGGRAMLAALPEDEAARLIRSDPLLSDSERDEIEQALPDVRTRGYAFGVHLMTPHAWSLAAPVFDRSGVVTSVLVISGPDIRIDDDIATRHSELLVPAARELSRLLGAPSLATDAETNWSDLCDDGSLERAS